MHLRGRDLLRVVLLVQINVYATASGVFSSPVLTRRPSIVPASSSTYPLRGGSAAALRTDGRKKVGKELARPTFMKWHQIPDENWKTKDGAEVIKWDPSLEQCKGSLQYRYGKYKELKSRICEVEGSLEQFALGYVAIPDKYIPKF
jgi:hypothetical protein